MRRATEPLHPTRPAQLRQRMEDVAADEAGALFPCNTRLVTPEENPGETEDFSIRDGQDTS